MTSNRQTCQVFLRLTLHSRGCFHACISYQNQPINNGEFDMIVLSGELALSQPVPSSYVFSLPTPQTFDRWATFTFLPCSSTLSDHQHLVCPSLDFYVKLHSFFPPQRMRRILLNATCPPLGWASTSRLTFTMPTTAQAHRGIFLPYTWAPLSAGPPPLLRRTMKTHPPSATPLRRWRNPRRCTAMCHQRLALLFLPLNPPPESVYDLHLVTNTVKWQSECR